MLSPSDYSMNSMIQKLAKIHPLLPKIVHYFWVSLLIVFVELAVFWMIDTGLQWHYNIAIVISFGIATLINWYVSRAFVFQSGTKKAHHELALIAFAALVTLGIQLIITTITVEWLGGAAIIGKIIALGISFFWNFWFRHFYIFNE